MRTQGRKRYSASHETQEQGLRNDPRVREIACVLTKHEMVLRHIVHCFTGGIRKTVNVFLNVAKVSASPMKGIQDKSRVHHTV